MKVVIIHSSVSAGREIADQLGAFASVVVAQGMSQVREIRSTGAVLLFVSQDIASHVKAQLPSDPMYVLPKSFDLSYALQQIEQAESKLGVATTIEASRNDATVRQNSEMPAPVPVMDNPVMFRKRRIPVVVFMSPKGGQGRTTVCTHMAAYGAARAKRVAIIDLDVNCNAAEKFGQTAQFASDGWRGSSIHDALSKGAAVEAMPNVYVFSYGRHLEGDMTLIDHEDVQHALQVCVEEVDTVLIDTKQEWGPIHAFLLAQATQVAYVVAAQKDALNNLSMRTRDLEERMKQRQSDVYCILNQTSGPKDMDAFQAYLIPYMPQTTIPFDAKYKELGGLGLRPLIARCAPWWDQIFGFPVVAQKRRLGWLFFWRK